MVDICLQKRCKGLLDKWQDGGGRPLSSYDELLLQSLQSLEHLQPLLYRLPLFRKKIIFDNSVAPMSNNSAICFW